MCRVGREETWKLLEQVMFGKVSQHFRVFDNHFVMLFFIISLFTFDTESEYSKIIYALAGRLESMVSGGSFQSLKFWDSVYQPDA